MKALIRSKGFHEEVLISKPLYGCGTLVWHEYKKQKVGDIWEELDVCET